MNILENLIYRDRFILVLNKPSGIPVHQGPSKKTSLEDFFKDLCFELPRPPSLAHRLDADTSGVLILGRHRKALRRLGELFRNNRIEKTYLAIVERTPVESEGTISLPIFKENSKTNGWKIVIDHNFGQESITYYKILKQLADGKALLELKPKTGRTHQLRVHCQAMGWPIVGDSLYGSGNREAGDKLFLHAYKIKIPLYPKKDDIELTAELPNYFNEFLK